MEPNESRNSVFLSQGTARASGGGASRATPFWGNKNEGQKGANMAKAGKEADQNQSSLGTLSGNRLSVP